MKQINSIVNVVFELRRVISLKSSILYVCGRKKSKDSIFLKVNNRSCSIRELNDLLGVRIVTPSIKSCYRALEAVCANYTYISSRLKDYIKHPKDNGYQSLHATIIHPFNKKVEVQIRTFSMDKNAQFGAASHNLYKIEEYGRAYVRKLCKAKK